MERGSSSQTSRIADHARSSSLFSVKTIENGGDEVGVCEHETGLAIPETFIRSHVDGQERSTSHQPHDSLVSPTIANKSLLSRGIHERKNPRPAQFSTFLREPLQLEDTIQDRLDSVDEDDAMTPVTRNASLPPHLRSKTASKATQLEQISQPKVHVSGDGQNVPDRSITSKGEAQTWKPPIEGEELRKKLAEEHNVNVGAPKPAVLVPYASSEEDFDNKVNGYQSSQKKRSSTTESKRGKLSSRGRGASRGGGRQPRNSRWPTTAEQRPDPKRWEIKWESSEEGSNSTVDSACANAGFGEGKKKRKQVEDGIDPDTGFRLTDWSGNWTPAPVDWDSRPAFRDGQSVQKIEQWLNGIEQEMRRAVGSKSWAISNANVNIDGVTHYFAPDPKKAQLPMIGDIAPRYWIPISFGHHSSDTAPQAPQTFWSELVKSDTPIPYDEDDLVGVKPWWEMYQVKGGYSLKDYAAPRIDDIDPDENADEKAARERDRGSHYQAENRANQERAKKSAQRERRKNAQQKARKISEARFEDAIEEHNENAIKIGINLFVRSARLEDVPRIREIYNYYIDNSVVAPETVRRTDRDMRSRLADVRQNRLPFLVACEPGGKVLARRKKDKGEEIILPDRVVGFALADDYNDFQGMYRFTAEVEVFTDKDKYMKGIAKCLLDKLMSLLDPMYVAKGGYDVVGDDLQDGPQRRISNVIVNVPYDPNTPRLAWMEQNLLKWMGFEKVGDLKGIGLKEGKR